MAYREDFMSLRPPKRLPDGRLRADAWFSRVGVQEYVEPGGKVRREYRPPEEVFHPDSLAAFEGLIVTDEHPPEMISAENARRYRRGQAGERARKDGQHVAGTIYVDDADLIRAMQRRERPKKELSVGYHLEIDETPGVTPDGQRYDAVQRRIRPNHIAITERGRAGTAHVRLDSASTGRPFEFARQKELSMKEKDQQNAGATQALADALTRNKALEAELAREKSRADAAEGRVAGLEQTIETMKKERTDSPERIAELELDRDKHKERADAAEVALSNVPKLVAEGVARRVKIEKGAIAVLGPKDEKGEPRRFDDLSDREIMEHVVHQISGAELKDKSLDYVSARFDACVESYEAGSRAISESARVLRIEQTRMQDAARVDSSEKKRQDSIKNRQDAWKKPLPSTRLVGGQ